MADVAALLGSILESVSPASPPVVASQSGGVAPDQWSLEEQGRDAAAHSASVDVTDASSPGTRGAQARANSHQVGGVGSPLSSCMGRVLDGEISLRLRKTTLLVRPTARAAHAPRLAPRACLGADSWPHCSVHACALGRTNSQQPSADPPHRSRTRVIRLRCSRRRYSSFGRAWPPSMARTHGRYVACPPSVRSLPPCRRCTALSRAQRATYLRGGTPRRLCSSRWGCPSWSS